MFILLIWSDKKTYKTGGNVITMDIEKIKTFFQSIDGVEDKKIASLITEGISERGFNGLPLDKEIENSIKQIESEYESQFIEKDNDETQDNTN